MNPLGAVAVLVLCAYVFFKGSEGWAIVAFIVGMGVLISQ